MPPPGGAYYEIIEPWDDIAKGELIFVWVNREDGTLHGTSLEKTYVLEKDDLERLRLCPDGPQRRQQQLLDLQRAMTANQQAAPPGTTLDLPASEERGTGTEPNPGSGLVLLNSDVRSQLVQRKRAAVQAHKEALKLQKKMQALLHEQQKALEVMARKWGAELDRLQYAIESINLYLGREEQVTPIQEGQRADPAEPICIRQTILYMDEECALLTDEGGIDFRNLDDFDQWLCQPDHLRQILPEKKGIIALKIRRGDKFYANEDIWTQLMLHNLNRQTYILIRNGDCLWRIWNEIELGEHLFPTQREFDELFLDYWSKEPLRPGTTQYQKALNEATGRTKQYFKVILMLQGIIDRTRVFQPVNTKRINLLDPNPDASQVHLIRDAERALSAGKPAFREWQKTLNDRLDSGKRIIFGGTGYQRRHYEDESHRRTGRKNAPWPDRIQIYALTPPADVTEDDGFILSYTWEESFTKARRSGTFRICKHDDFILNFDDASLEDMEHYYSDRHVRQNYLATIPLLRAAIRLKREETERERPFIELLRRQAVEQQGLSEEEAGRYLAEVVPWWKQCTRHTVSLTQKEKSAYRQILSEIALRRRIDRNPAGLNTVERIQRRSHDWLVIAKDTGGTVVCVRRRADSDGYICLETWDTKGEKLLKKQDLHFLKPDSLRWRILAAQPEWEQWPKDGRCERFLRPDEITKLLEFLRNDYAENFIHLCAITSSDRAFYVYGLRESNTWSGGKGRIEWTTKELRWFRQSRRGEAKFDTYHHCATLDARLALSPEDNNLNAIPTKGEENARFARSWDISRRKGLPEHMRKLPFSAFGKYLHFYDPALTQKAIIALRKAEHRQNKANVRRDLIRSCVEAVERCLEEQFWERQKRLYLEDGGDLDLWPDERKTIKPRIPNLHETDLEDCITLLVNKGEKVEGLTIKEVWEKAREHGWVDQRPDSNRNVPAQLKIPGASET